ncbi:uncharacterized protein NFIA_024260 [Aspergillus fischeri NRRL 181]|uniref:Uncharacterized protein n=1 Tax=Neosartorya fischeri (strain ATCC 1020 / DSM 3700 / CBS 544.65 / FGSC A1164 / JCM 1740 / NRRL 181 / WB 181) TaxID=331117 RepID=A1D5J3_NEOFI|nr:uncharacterized protein NFIA_024260 [Aspergillus fischeri NRRL 181]EAW22047.1 hypothetical protein NFIA_024260 [Aspergillus fischeri NRRL 181]
MDVPVKGLRKPVSNSQFPLRHAPHQYLAVLSLPRSLQTIIPVHGWKNMTKNMTRSQQSMLTKCEKPVHIRRILAEEEMLDSRLHRQSYLVLDGFDGRPCPKDSYPIFFKGSITSAKKKTY